tara:strand:- start:305 stop:550 length:246 start_codon:yes stop_codon:yes gene_type:complete
VSFLISLPPALNGRLHVFPFGNRDRYEEAQREFGLVLVSFSMRSFQFRSKDRYFYLLLSSLTNPISLSFPIRYDSIFSSSF